MKNLYTTRAIAHGGRAGKVKTDDGLLALDLALPKAMGGAGNATNPEQLFAAGYAACFENAVLHVARGKKLKIDEQGLEVTAEVGIGANESGGFQLAVSLAVAISGVDQATADELVKTAHSVCPYSNAVKGNIDVGLTVSVK
jgi:osmotically inducible protein OsmC